MKTYIQPTLQDDKSYVAIIHVRCNGVRKEELSSEQIPRGIIQLGNIYQDHQFNGIFISSLACCNSVHLNKKINSVKIF